MSKKRKARKHPEAAAAAAVAEAPEHAPKHSKHPKAKSRFKSPRAAAARARTSGRAKRGAPLPAHILAYKAHYLKSQIHKRIDELEDAAQAPELKRPGHKRDMYLGPIQEAIHDHEILSST